MRYDKNKADLSKKQALKFLKDLAQAAKVNYVEETALKLVNDCDVNGTGKIGFEEFKNLFYSATKQCSLSLTESLRVVVREKPIVEYSPTLKKAETDQIEKRIRHVIDSGDLNELQVLIKNYKNISLNGPQITRGNLLHYSCRAAKFEIVQYLVEQGFDVNSKDANGTQPLYLASGAQVVSYHRKQNVCVLQIDEEPKEYKENRINVVKLLLASKADVQSKGFLMDKKIQYSSLYAAAYTNDLELFQLLHNTGVPLSLGICPIFNAIAGARVKIVEYILQIQKKYQPDVCVIDIYGKSPLQRAKIEFVDEKQEEKFGGGRGVLLRCAEIVEMLGGEISSLSFEETCSSSEDRELRKNGKEEEGSGSSGEKEEEENNGVKKKEKEEVDRAKKEENDGGKKKGEEGQISIRGKVEDGQKKEEQGQSSSRGKREERQSNTRGKEEEGQSNSSRGKGEERQSNTSGKEEEGQNNSSRGKGEERQSNTRGKEEEGQSNSSRGKGEERQSNRGERQSNRGKGEERQSNTKGKGEEGQISSSRGKEEEGQSNSSRGKGEEVILTDKGKGEEGQDFSLKKGKDRFGSVKKKREEGSSSSRGKDSPKKGEDGQDSQRKGSVKKKKEEATSNRGKDGEGKGSIKEEEGNKKDEKELVTGIVKT